MQPSPASSRRSKPGLRALAVLVLVFIVMAVPLVVIGSGYHFTLFPTQPRVAMTDVAYTPLGCGFDEPHWWTFVFTFNLTNAGNADAFVGVDLSLNGTPGVGTHRDFSIRVLQGTYTNQQANVYAPDCGTYHPGAAIISVDKACGWDRC